MHEDLKRKLDETVPEDVTLSEAKKRQIMRAAQEQKNEQKTSRVPKFLPVLAGAAVIVLSGVLAYPYLMENEPSAPTEIRSGEENQLPSEEIAEDPESLPVGDEEPEEDTEEKIDERIEDDPEEETEDMTKETPDKNEEIESQPLTKKEKFIALLNHEFFETGIELGDDVAEIEKNHPNWVNKGSYEGGVTIAYENYILIHSIHETTINNILLRGFEQLTVSQIEEVIGQEIEVVTYFNEIDGEENSSGEFFLEGQGYGVVAESEAKDARVIEVIMSTNHKE